MENKQHPNMRKILQTADSVRLVVRRQKLYITRRLFDEARLPRDAEFCFVATAHHADGWKCVLVFFRHGYFFVRSTVRHMAMKIRIVPQIVQAFIIFSCGRSPVSRATCAKMHAKTGFRKNAIEPT